MSDKLKGIWKEVVVA